MYVIISGFLWIGVLKLLNKLDMWSEDIMIVSCSRFPAILAVDKTDQEAFLCNTNGNYTDSSVS